MSPRIVWAAVVGSRGSVRVRGTALRTKLGLDDTWASFNRFSTKQKPSVPPTQTTPTTPGGGVQGTSSALLQGRHPRLFPKAFHPGKPARLYGSLWPAPRHALAKVQRQARDGSWHTVGRTRLNKRGYYNVAVKGKGMFRVTVGPLAGPAVQVN